MDRSSENIERWRLEFGRLLDSATTTEEEIHQFLGSTPVFLPLYWPYQNRVFSKLRLGAEYVADFAYARKTTIGLLWYFVEIESPKSKLFQKNGGPTATLTHAIRQVRDWETWFQRHRGYASEHLPFAATKIRTIHQPELIVVAGRRAGLSDADRERMERVGGDHLEVMTFDRLLEERGSGCLGQFTLTTSAFRERRIEQLWGINLVDGAMPYPRDETD